MWLQNASNTEHRTVLTVCTSNAGCGMCQVSPGSEGGRGNKPIPSLLRDSPCLPSLSLGEQGWATSSPPPRAGALLSPAYPSPLSSRRGSRRAGLGGSSCRGMFGGGCCRPGGETRRTRWLPRQGKRDAGTDGCVHREHCLGGEQCVGGCPDRAASPQKNSPGWITPVGTYTMITISFPGPLCQYGVATQPATSRRAVSLLSTLWFWFRIFLDEALFDYSGSTWGICNSNNLW